MKGSSLVWSHEEEEGGGRGSKIHGEYFGLHVIQALAARGFGDSNSAGSHRWRLLKPLDTVTLTNHGVRDRSGEWRNSVPRSCL